MTVTQNVRSDALLYANELGGITDGSFDGAGVDRTPRIAPVKKKVGLWPGASPVCTKASNEFDAETRDAGFAALARADENDSTRVVDVGGPEVERLAKSKTCAVESACDRKGSGIVDGIDDALCVSDAQDDASWFWYAGRL
jgi:hypothetical protein